MVARAWVDVTVSALAGQRALAVRARLEGYLSRWVGDEFGTKFATWSRRRGGERYQFAVWRHFVRGHPLALR